MDPMGYGTITKQIAIFIGRVLYAVAGFGDKYWCDAIELDKEARICLDSSSWVRCLSIQGFRIWWTNIAIENGHL